VRGLLPRPRAEAFRPDTFHPGVTDVISPSTEASGMSKI
jgi:hypothetical protein